MVPPDTSLKYPPSLHYSSSIGDVCLLTGIAQCGGAVQMILSTREVLDTTKARSCWCSLSNSDHTFTIDTQCKKKKKKKKC